MFLGAHILAIPDMCACSTSVKRSRCMNVIVIMSDTFRRDNLRCYNEKTVVKTPNLDRFAAESFVFDRAYCASFPTVPNRFDIFTGTHCFVKQDWSPLPFQEVVISQILAEGGFHTALISDTPHIIQHGFNYERGFAHYLWIRGQENDALYSFPESVEFPCSADKVRSPAVNLLPHLRNASHRRYEEDCFAPRTMLEACRWLEKNYNRGDFFLWIDTFDPHEPWDPPEYYVDMYDPGYIGERIIYPRYYPIAHFKKEEINHCQALYHGETTMVDRWIGRVLEQVDYLGLSDSTAIIFTSDHGILFGEHGFMGKSFISNDYFETIRLYEEIIHIPLLIRMPGQGEQKRIRGLVTSTDLMPTIMEMLDLIDTARDGGTTLIQTLQCGFTQPEHWSIDAEKLHGISFLSMMNGKKNHIHDVIVSSFPLTHGTPRLDKSVITTEEWSLHVSGISSDPQNELTPPKDLPYSSDPADYHPGETHAALFHLPSDTGQIKNVIRENPGIAEELHSQYVRKLQEWGLSKDRLALNKTLILEQ
jgi:arylsulfatase A-like enzyme